MDASLVTLTAGNVVCAIPDCSASLSFQLMTVMDHFKRFHATTLLPKRPTLSYHPKNLLCNFSFVTTTPSLVLCVIAIYL